jgi:hypothetical protein
MIRTPLERWRGQRKRKDFNTEGTEEEHRGHRENREKSGPPPFLHQGKRSAGPTESAWRGLGQ